MKGFGGPLTQSWLDQRKALNVQMLARMRGLGMKPALSAFAGHAPGLLTPGGRRGAPAPLGLAIPSGSHPLPIENACDLMGAVYTSLPTPPAPPPLRPLA
jgi:hypothetical protein